MDETKVRILRLLAENGRMTNEEVAERLSISERKVKSSISDMEKKGIIAGYRAMFDETLLPETKVKAIIEVKTRPERNGGFDRIARRISNFSRVESVSLVSGGFDLLLEVKGENLNDVAEFVSSKLATIDGVISTSTHFMLKKYKELGKMMEYEEDHERLQVSP